MYTWIVLLIRDLDTLWGGVIEWQMEWISESTYLVYFLAA